MQFKFSIAIIKASIIAVLSSQVVFALPELTKVVNGDVNLATEGANLQINQASDKAIIHWNSFNIGAQESVKFNQPHNGICLNRVDSSNGMSQIAGQLSSNNNIILINQAGILFADSARVNIGGIIASTADITDANFLDTNDDKIMRFEHSVSQPAAIINHGEIKLAESDRGLVTLLGNNVVNDGVISANLGDVMIGSGQKFTLDFMGDWVINFAVEALATQAAMDEKGNKLADGITMPGQIFIDGGSISMRASAANDVFDNLINMSGETRANSVHYKFEHARGYTSSGSRDGGEICLYGNENGTVKISGLLDVDSKIDGLRPGGIIVLSDNVVITSDAKLTASAFGEEEAGEIMLGNLVHLNVAHIHLTPSKRILVESGASLNADSIAKGNGGNVVIWATEEINVQGNVSAKAGAESGNGGSINILGLKKTNVDPEAKIDVSSANGKPGIIAISNR